MQSAVYTGGGVALFAVTLLVTWISLSRNRAEAEERGRRSDRAVSEVVGVVLLFGLVLAGAAVVILSGASVTESVNDERRIEEAEVNMKEVDGRVGSMDQSDDPVSIDPVGDSGDGTGAMRLQESTSSVEFSINGSAACSSSVELGSIRYVTTSDRWVAYEGGGVWRNEGGMTMMVSAPDLTYDNGSVNFVAHNVSGSGNTTQGVQLRRNVDQSATQTDTFMRDHLTESASGDLCKPREELHVVVESPYYRAWADYFRQEFPNSTTITVNSSNESVLMVLDDELRGADSDGDGVPDAKDNCETEYNPGQRNTDGDAKGDVCDPNDDNDGVDDGSDLCPKAEPPGGKTNHDDKDGDGLGDVCDPDTDGDGYYDGNLGVTGPDKLPDPYRGKYNNSSLYGGSTVDNCPSVYNPNQNDTDGDSMGDACDPDDDGDGVRDPWEPGSDDDCPRTPNSGQVDTDNGGRGDKCDPDDDGDGIDDGADNCRLVPNNPQKDTDSDGVGDACDGDADGDGVNNSVDNCPTTPNPGQENTDAKNGGDPSTNPRGDACDPDDDGDVKDDAADNCPKEYNPAQKDPDGDGKGIPCDPDESYGSPPSGSPPSTTDDFVDIKAIDGSNYRKVSITASVDTTEARNGKLDDDDFRVFEDGVERPLTSVTFSEDTKVDIVFVFDVTGSMGEQIQDMQDNTIDFANDLENEGLDARYALVTFRDSNGVRQGFTGEASEFKDAVDTMTAAGGGDGPEDSFDAIMTGGKLNFRDDAERVVVHVTDAPSHDNARSSTSDSAITTELNDKDVTFYSASPPRDNYAGSYCFEPGMGGGSWDYLDIVDDTDGVWLNMCSVSGFEPFLEDIKDDLTDRYKVTFKTCRPGDGSEREVLLYAQSEGETARDDINYTAPDDNTTDECGASPPTPDPEPDTPLPPLPGGTPSDVDAPFDPPASCDKGKTPSPGAAPSDPTAVPDDGCYPSDRIDWGPDGSPTVYSTAITVRVNVIETED